MQLSGIVVAFEEAIKSYLGANYGTLDLTKPQYSITRLGQGQYDITLSITGLGVQHVYIGLVGDELTIKGKVALIGDKASFPFAIFSELINSTILRWLERAMDSAATKTPGTAIALAQAPALALQTDLNPVVSEVSVDIGKK